VVGCDAGGIGEAPFRGGEAADTCIDTGFDEIFLHGVVGVEVGDEEGEDGVEAGKGGGQAREVGIVYLLVGNARGWVRGGVGAGEDDDFVVA
jgi:hypothetical protein